MVMKAMIDVSYLCRMGKKKLPKKEKPKPKKLDLKIDQEEEKPFDFGGLPDRDLKKNLGCG
jgi:hypothetical protein